MYVTSIKEVSVLIDGKEVGAIHRRLAAQRLPPSYSARWRGNWFREPFASIGAAAEAIEARERASIYAEEEA